MSPFLRLFLCGLAVGWMMIIAFQSLPPGFITLGYMIVGAVLVALAVSRNDKPIPIRALLRGYRHSDNTRSLWYVSVGVRPDGTVFAPEDPECRLMTPIGQGKMDSLAVYWEIDRGNAPGDVVVLGRPYHDSQEGVDAEIAHRRKYAE